MFLMEKVFQHLSVSPFQCNPPKAQRTCHRRIKQVRNANNFISICFSMGWNRMLSCDVFSEIAVNGSIQPPFSLVQPEDGHLETDIMN